MSVNSGSLTFGTAPVVVVTTPPGPCGVLLTCLAGTAYVGFGGSAVTAGTATNGLTLPSGLQAPFTLTKSDAPMVISGVGGGSPTTLSWLISTRQ